MRRLLLAIAAGAALPVSMLGALLGRDPAGVDELIATTRAAGLIGADGRLAPIVRRAVTALSPATDRTAVWRQLTELQLARGGAVLPLVRSLLAVGALGDCPAPTLAAAADEALADEPAFAAELFAAATAAGRPANAQQALATALAGNLDDALRLADRLLATATPPTAPRPPWSPRPRWPTVVTSVAAWSCTGGRAAPRRWPSPSSAGLPPATWAPPPSRRRAIRPGNRPPCTPVPPD
ncbi:hypothetical protein NKG94_05370 [Micromonospora sp. M12]